MRATDLPPAKRTLLITGCSSGIGRHCALAFKQRGYRVFATARQPEDVKELLNLGLEALQLDLNESKSIHLAVEQLWQATNGQLFALFNNAGFGQPGAVEDLTREMLRAQFETNLFGLVELMNLILPVMRRQGYGKIIQTSSILGIISLPFRGAYNASKHALEGLTDTLRLELCGTGIEVSLIEPGPIQSRFRYNAYQKFLQNVSVKESPFNGIYQLLQERLANQIKDPPGTLTPTAIEKALWHALTADKAKARYYVTLPAHLFNWLKRCLSTRVLDKILLRAAGEEGELLTRSLYKKKEKE